jgi:hypothetical protein
VPRNKESEEKLRVDILRQIDYLAHHTDRSIALGELTTVGLIACLVAVSLYVSNRSNTIIAVSLAYAGAVLWVGKWRSPSRIGKAAFEFPFDSGYWIANVELSIMHIQDILPK